MSPNYWHILGNENKFICLHVACKDIYGMWGAKFWNFETLKFNISSSAAPWFCLSDFLTQIYLAFHTHIIVHCQTYRWWAWCRRHISWRTGCRSSWGSRRSRPVRWSAGRPAALCSRCRRSTPCARAGPGSSRPQWWWAEKGVSQKRTAATVC